MQDLRKKLTRDEYKAITKETSDYVWHEVLGKGRDLREVLNELSCDGVHDDVHAIVKCKSCVHAIDAM